MRRRDTTTVDTGPVLRTKARCSASTDCRCGQGLDVSARAHCPRCGRSITRP